MLAVLAQTVFGPNGFHPWTLFWLVIYGMTVRGFVRAVSFADTGGDAVDLLLPNLFQGVVLAGAAGLLLAGLPRLLRLERRPPDNRPGRVGYLTVIMLTAIGLGLTMTIVTRFIYPDPLLAQSLTVRTEAFLGIVLGFFVVLIALGNGVAARFALRTRRHELRLRSELDEVRADRIVLLAADERARSEIARSLHDDVQTELLRASMRLHPLLDRLDGDDRTALETALQEIELARERGVRSVGRRLAPPLATQGLVAAVRELCESTRGVLDIDVESSPAFIERFRRTSDEDPIAIAIYRAAEQGLQNALKHAEARRGRLVLDVDADGRATLELTADGLPIAPDWQPGLGSMVLDAWVDAVGGGWSLTPSDDSRATLRVAFGR